MEYEHVLSGLTRKRAELAGELIVVEAKAEKLRADLNALDDAIRIFNPEAKPNEIKPIRPVVRNVWFAQGECLRMIYDILRVAQQPMSTREITDQLMSVKGIPGAGRNVELVCKTVLGSLGRATGIKRLVIGGTVAWKIA